MAERRFKLVLVVLFVVLLAVPALAQTETAVTINKSVLRAQPDHQAKEVTTLAAGQPVEILERQGGWYRVSGPNITSGWLPLLSIRKVATGETPVKEKSSGLRSLLGSFRTGSSGVTVATGVRGLDAVDLEKSKPNMDELMRIHQFASSDDEARRYAAKSGLVTRDIAWLEAPGKGR